MRITIIAIGSRGDVQPYVALGAGLRRAGHAVRLATHPRFCGEAREHGLDSAPIAEGALSRGTATRSGRAWLRLAPLLPGWIGMLEDAASVAERRLADARRATDDAEVIVTSVLGTLLGLQLAAARDVPLVRAYCAPPGRLERPAMRQALWLCARPFANRARRIALGLPPLGLREPFGRLDRERVPLLYGFSPTVVPPRRSPPEWVDVTGYWALPASPDWTPPAALSAFLAGGPAPVVVSFGDQADRHPDRTTAVLLDALRRAGQRGVLVRGRHLAAGAPLPPDVLAVDPLPHAWLFPRAAAVVHHGGAGTTFSALRAGVPSIVVPGFADQPFWGRRVHALGAGPAPIPRRRLTARRLAPAIRSAATDPVLRERAATLARALAGEDGVGTAVASLERRLDRRDPSVLSSHLHQEASCTSRSSSLV